MAVYSMTLPFFSVHFALSPVTDTRFLALLDLISFAMFGFCSTSDFSVLNVSTACFAVAETTTTFVPG